MIFNDKDFSVVKKIIEHDLCKISAMQIKLLETKVNYLNQQEITDKDIGINNHFSYYSSLISESLLLFLKHPVEHIVNTKLSPTHSYAHIFYENSSVDKQLLKNSCEYTVILCLSIDEKPLEICLKDKLQNDIFIPLLPGDALIYKGNKLEYSRSKYVGKQHIEVHLHYVGSNGIYSNYMLDNRDILGINKQGSCSDINC